MTATGEPEGVTTARTAFGWTDPVEILVGPQGAQGTLWHVVVGSRHYAVKEIFDDPPDPDWIQHELAYTDIARGAGARAPVSHPDRDGRYLVPTPHGTWIRCYEWVDLHPVARDATDTARAIGALLARLHREAPARAVEFDGTSPDPWYHQVPDSGQWARVTDAARATAWGPALTERAGGFAELGATVSAVDPSTLVTCHRDLHPENVFRDPVGALTVIDFDDAGPATPTREVARAVFDWFCDSSRTDAGAISTLLRAYRNAGGPGRITEVADFSMLLAGRLNFILSQALLALDPLAGPQRRARAESELATMLQLWPDRTQIDDVLALCGRVFR